MLSFDPNTGLTHYHPVLGDGSFDFSICSGCAVETLAYDDEVQEDVRGLIASGAVRAVELAEGVDPQVVRLAKAHRAMNAIVGTVRSEPCPH